MAITDKYEFEEVAYGTTGWNAILTANVQKMESYLHTYLYYPIASGEVIAAYDPLAIKNKEFKKARRNTTSSRVACFAIEAGVSGEYIRGQRIGEMTKSGEWFFNGSGEIYLTNAGDITNYPSGETDKPLGISISSDTILIEL